MTSDKQPSKFSNNGSHQIEVIQQKLECSMNEQFQQKILFVHEEKIYCIVFEGSFSYFEIIENMKNFETLANNKTLLQKELLATLEHHVDYSMITKNGFVYTLESDFNKRNHRHKRNTIPDKYIIEIPENGCVYKADLCSGVNMNIFTVATNIKI